MPLIFPPNFPDTGGRLDRMREAIFAGNLTEVKFLMSEIKTIPNGTQFLYNEGGPLFAAVHNGNVSIVEYLFAEGALFHLRLAEQAVDNKDIPMLEALLKHGWKINQPQNMRNPPLLWYVERRAASE